MSFAEALQSKADQTQQSHPSQAAAASTFTVDQPRVHTSSKWQQAGQSAPAQIVNSSPRDNMVRVVTVVQQFMTEYNGAVSKEAKIQAISKIVLTLLEKMTSRVHRPLKILAFNANGIGRQRHKLSKQLQDLSIDVVLFSETP
jgi:hypothetical protein